MKIKTIQKSVLCMLLVALCALAFIFAGVGFAGQSANSAETANKSLNEAALRQHPTASLPFLDINIVGKNGNSWIIQITNNNSYSVEVIYNAKMCLENDAKGWKKLKNIVPFTLGAGQTTTPEADGDSAKPHHAKIAQNGFAGFIAISFVGSGYRYISYANKLNANTNMQPYYTVL